jgi:Holliday junction resolvasome RuvABC DNA-binding subunit
MMKITSNKSIKENTSKKNNLKNLKNMTIMALKQLGYQERGVRGASWLWSF